MVEASSCFAVVFFLLLFTRSLFLRQVSSCLLSFRLRLLLLRFSSRRFSPCETFLSVLLSFLILSSSLSYSASFITANLVLGHASSYSFVLLLRRLHPYQALFKNEWHIATQCERTQPYPPLFKTYLLTLYGWCLTVWQFVFQLEIFHHRNFVILKMALFLFVFF